MEATHCENCGKSPPKLQRCSGCGEVLYCGSACQKAHWRSSHRSICHPYSLTEVEGKGLGLVATRTIGQGDTILKEDPVLILKLTTEDKVSELNGQFQMASKSTRKKILSLHDPGDEDGDKPQKLWRIFTINNIQIKAGETSGLFPNISRLNHSCAPNVVWSYILNKPNRKEVRALRRIEKGEELCVNYVDDVETNYCDSVTRQEALKMWGFRCRCEVCSLEPQERVKNDTIRQEIWQLHALVPNLIADRKLPECIDAARRKVFLLEQISRQLAADLPAAYMELYELLAIGQASGLDIQEDPDKYRKTAEDLVYKFGDKFVHEYRVKYQDILHGD